MNLLIKFILLIAIFAIASCATLTSDIEVETHSNPKINFHTYNTYTWADNAQIVFDPIGQWEQPTFDTDEEVRSIIDRELQARNIKLVDHNPNLLVTFSAGIDFTAPALKGFSDSADEALIKTPKDALVITLVDIKTGDTVLIGSASGDAQKQQTIENILARINYAISEIFKAL